MLQTILQALALSILVRHHLLELYDLGVGLVLPLLDLLGVLELLLQSLLEFEFDNNGVLLQVQQALDFLVHRLVLVLEAHHIRQALHEEVDAVPESLLQLLVVANEGEHLLAEVCSCMRGQVDSSADIVGPVDGLVVHNLDKGIHEGVEWVRAVHVVVRWELSLEWDVAGSQLLQLCYDVARLLVPHLELVHFKLLPGVDLWQLLLVFGRGRFVACAAHVWICASAPGFGGVSLVMYGVKLYLSCWVHHPIYLLCLIGLSKAHIFGGQAVQQIGILNVELRESLLALASTRAILSATRP